MMDTHKLLREYLRNVLRESYDIVPYMERAKSIEEFLSLFVGKTLREVLSMTSIVHLYFDNRYGIGRTPERGKVMSELIDSVYAFVHRRHRTEMDELIERERNPSEREKRDFGFDEYERIGHEYQARISALSAKMRVLPPGPERDDVVTRVRELLREKLAALDTTEWSRHVKDMMDERRRLSMDIDGRVVTEQDIEPDGSDEWYRLRDAFDEFITYM